MTSHRELAELEFHQRRYFLAAKFAQYALAEDDEDYATQRILGLACLSLGELDLGIESLEQAALLRPLDVSAQIELAIAYGQAGRKGLSRDLLMAQATSGLLAPSELLRVAIGLEAADAPRLAMEACRQAGQLAPDSAEIHYQMGYFANRCGYPPNVSESLIRHAIKLEPDNLHYRIGLASLLVRLQRQHDALFVLKDTIPQRLGEVTCRCCLRRIANLFFDCGDLERAKQCASRLQLILQADENDSAVAADDRELVS